MSKTTREHPFSQEVTEIHNQIINQISSSNITYKSIAEETKDPELSKRMDKLLYESDTDIKYNLQDGIIFKYNHVVIPSKLQKTYPG